VEIDAATGRAQGASSDLVAQATGGLPGPRPGWNTAVDERDWEKKPVPFGFEGDYLTSTDIWTRVNQATERWFLMSFFLQFQMMIEQGKTPPTATQIIKADSQALAQIGGGIQGVERTLWSIDDRVFEILYHAGYCRRRRISCCGRPRKKGLTGLDGVSCRLSGSSLAGAESQCDLAAAHVGATACAPWLVLDEMAALKFKVPDIIERIMEEVGVWEDTLRSADEYEEVIEQTIEREERRAQIALGKTQADTVKA